MPELLSVFDPDYYDLNNPDLVDAGFITPDQLFNHFVQFGVNEFRSFSPYIELDVYATANPDLATAGLTTGAQLLDHLLVAGINEKRIFSDDFTLTGYQEANPDLIGAGLTTGEQLFDHLINYGASEGRPGAPVIDSPSNGVPLEQPLLALAPPAPAPPAPSLSNLLNSSNVQQSRGDLRGWTQEVLDWNGNFIYNSPDFVGRTDGRNGLDIDWGDFSPSNGGCVDFGNGCVQGRSNTDNFFVSHLINDDSFFEAGKTYRFTVSEADDGFFIFARPKNQPNTRISITPANEWQYNYRGGSLQVGFSQ